MGLAYYHQPHYFFTPTRRLVIIAAKKYTEEKVNAVYDGDIYTIINLTPVIHKDDRQEQKNEIEKTLYTVFSKYTPKKNKTEDIDGRFYLRKTVC